MTHSFDPRWRSILLPALAVGSKDQSVLLMVLDTGATETAIDVRELDQIGADIVEGSEGVTHTAAGLLSSPLRRVAKLDVLGVEMRDIQGRAFDLYDRLNVAGVIGWDILGKLKMTIDLPNGTIKIPKPTVKRTTKRKR